MNGKIEISNKSQQQLHSFDWNDNDNRSHKFTSIVILTYNKLEYTKLCIESIRKFTKSGCYEIIVIDNASTDETVNWLAEQDDITAIFNDTNKGFPAGCNQGIEIASGESVLLLNNDIIVAPYWLSNLNDALWSEDSIGAVGSSTNSISYLQAIKVDYDTVKGMLNFAKKQNNFKKTNWEQRIKLVGFSMLIKKSVLDEVGLLDEIFTPGNYEDDDLSYRIVKSGKKLLYCKNAFVHHFGSVSFDGASKKYLMLMAENRRKFKEKWKFDPNYSSNIRLDVINLIDEEDFEKPINVLEIGCGCGGSLLMVKARYKNANIYGLEIDEDSGGVASAIFPTVIGNIENETLPYEQDFFDYILIGDVIEHLIEPDEVLKKLYPYLKDEGRIVASIPNIMHISVIEDLFRGNFTYTDAGILDRTHLRFFTYFEIVKMFMRCKYEILKANTTYIATTESQNELIEMITSKYGEDIKYQYNAYQYIVSVKKAEIAVDTELKYLLMRLDNDVETDKSSEGIVKYYEENPSKFDKQVDVITQRCIINSGSLYNKIAVGLFSKNYLDKAEEFFKYSLNINKNDPDTVFNLSYLYAQKGDFSAADKLLCEYELQNELTDEFKELKEVVLQNLEAE